MTWLTMDEMYQAIYCLNCLDLRQETIPNIRRHYQGMLKGVVLPISTPPQSDMLFRARVLNDEPINQVKALMAPPADKVTEYHRCNGPGHPLFYASVNDGYAALREVRPKKGDIAYLSMWHNTRKIPGFFCFARQRERDQVHFFSASQKHLFQFLERCFSEKISEGFSYKYKLTAAFAQHVSANHDGAAGSDIGADGKVSFRYPSVVRNGSENVAMPPEWVEERLELVGVSKLQIVSFDESDYFPKVVCLDTAIDFSDGEIHWLGRAVSQFPEPKRLEFD
ncbi:hypothetical protein K4F84_09135 [Phaeobacter inhibens]|uniref:hypothetical protein n=1 Tax=Phaeobacter inhibens TaxID=221822 RepID=UPI0021A8D409|nr:hypothetical protein [Phaeobacter inhibens]UWR51396.1 hypothetical protein K4F84_09135 [Phaeobacter inhibens]